MNEAVYIEFKGIHDRHIIVKSYKLKANYNIIVCNIVINLSEINYSLLQNLLFM